MQRTVGPIQSLWQTRLGSLSQHGHKTRRPQIDSMVQHTVYVAVLGVGPFAATIKLSQNCCRATISPLFSVHCRTPDSVTDMSPMVRRRETDAPSPPV